MSDNRTYLEKPEERTVGGYLSGLIRPFRRTSVMEPSFIDTLTAPEGSPVDYHSLQGLLGSRLREALVDPGRRFIDAINAGFSGQPLGERERQGLLEGLMTIPAAGMMSGASRGGSTTLRSLAGGSGDSFEKWSKKYPVLSQSDISQAVPGQGLVVKAYHGTTNKFDVFDPTVKGTKEGQFGAVNYFSTDKADADINYAGMGPDLTHRVESRSEQIEFELEDMDQDYIRELSQEHDLSFDPDIESYPEDLPIKMAEQELVGSDPETMELFVRSDNPAFIGGDRDTWIDNDVREQYRQDAIDEIIDEHDISSKEISNYEDEIEERMNELSMYDEPPIYKAIDEALDDAGVEDVNTQDVYAELELYDGEVTATELEDRLRSAYTLMDAHDYDTGENIQSEIIGKVFQNLGYDSIVLQNADKRFPGMEMSPGTAHIHVFKETPSRIKSRQNVGTYSETDPNIFRSGGAPLFPWMQEDE